ncbi:hypothetical protein HMSSN036_53730 [Paenibacillus macerans]|uniref:acyl carrier protein n=1 Tax=Paenibacillus sp. FSL R5-0527 TaxID=2975321 RepID=UPI000979C36A|nr:hypothetical protein BK140_04555 [Paenibacillus macerans]GJM73157.1 hypothetical protein HMSSN036_53730 [Paenibacillus macerans]
MSADSLEQNIRFKLGKVLAVPAEDLSATEELIAWGLDSIKTVELIVELEECFDITFSDEELLFENFATVRLIVDRIRGKLVAPS